MEHERQKIPREGKEKLEKVGLKRRSEQLWRKTRSRKINFCEGEPLHGVLKGHAW